MLFNIKNTALLGRCATPFTLQSHGHISTYPFDRIAFHVLCQATVQIPHKENDYTNYQELCNDSVVHYKVRD